MAVATRTFIQVVQAVADRLGLRDSGTLTAATTSALTAANYPYKTNRTNADNSGYVGSEVYVTSGTPPVPNPNGISGYTPSTGVFDLSITGTVAAGNTATFDIYNRTVGINDIKGAVNEGLRKRYYQTYWPATIVADGDMSSSATSDWTSSSATHTKVSSVGTLVYGPKASRVLATGANGYIRTATIKVDPGNPSYYVQALVRADIGTARLIAYDVTNSATIASEDWDKEGWGIVNFQFDLPATCEELQIRLMSVASADDTYWNYLMLLPVGAESIPVPDWINRDGQIINVLRLPQTDPLRPEHSLSKPVIWYDIRENMSNPNSAFTLQFYPPVSGSVWVHVYRPFETLSADTDTTFMERNWVELAAQVELLYKMGVTGPPTSNSDDFKAQYMQLVPKLRRMDAARMPQRLRIQMPEPYSGTRNYRR